MPGKVYAISMSAIATTHMLVAAGTEDVRVRLCDLASGACTHTLSGHRGTYFPLARMWSVLEVNVSDVVCIIVWQMVCGHCSGLLPVSGCFTAEDVTELFVFGIFVGLAASKSLIIIVHRLKSGPLVPLKGKSR